MLTKNVSKKYYNIIRERFNSSLVCANIVSKLEYADNGMFHLMISDGDYEDVGSARRTKGAPIPHLKPCKEKIAHILKHNHDFSICDHDLTAFKNGKMLLPLQSALESARLIAESVDNMVFNGNAEYDIKGIYKDAGKNFKAEKGWNTKESNPYEDIISIVSSLSRNNRYKAKFMVLADDAYYRLFKSNEYDVIPMKLLKEMDIFPMGIFKAPNTVNPSHPPIIPSGCGLIGDYGPDIAERYVQWLPCPIKFERNSEYTDIILNEYPEYINGNWFFNVLTYQGFNMHRPDAFVRLENLIQ